MSLSQPELAVVMATKEGIKEVAAKFRRIHQTEALDDVANIIEALYAVDSMATRLIKVTPAPTPSEMIQHQN